MMKILKGKLMIKKIEQKSLKTGECIYIYNEVGIVR